MTPDRARLAGLPPQPWQFCPVCGRLLERLTPENRGMVPLPDIPDVVRHADGSPLCQAALALPDGGGERIRLLGDPILKQVAQPFTGDANALTQRLTAAMRAHNGIGLAAPQIGESVRVCVVALNEHFQLGLVNPRIIRRSDDEATELEGCLSIPGYEVPVRRAKVVTVETEQGETTFSGLQARAVQHEIDHLDGILILDRWLEQQRGHRAPPGEPSEAGIQAADRAYDAIVARYLDAGGPDTHAEASEPMRAAIRAYLAVDGRRAPPPGAPSEAITRVEVIDHRDGVNLKGRVFSAWDCRAELSYQDGGRTLKIFVDERAAPPPEEPTR